MFLFELEVDCTFPTIEPLETTWRTRFKAVNATEAYEKAGLFLSAFNYTPTYRLYVIDTVDKDQPRYPLPARTTLERV